MFIFSRKTIKYLAGLCDSDGHITLHFNKLASGEYKTAVRIKIAIDGNVRYLADKFGFNWRIEPGRDGRKDLEEIYISGESATVLLKKLLPYLRTKRHLAEWILSNHNKRLKSLTKIKREMSAVRNKTATLDNGESLDFIWLAGYFDGDGCIAFHKRRNECWLQVTGNANEKAILETFSKHLGGQVYAHTNNSVCYKKYLSKKGDDVINNIAEHVVIRKNQINKFLSLAY